MKPLFPPPLFRAGLLVLALACAGLRARADVTMQLDHDEINQGDTAQLTINASGNGSETVTPPVVAGLEFTAVTQSSQIQIINGATSATSTVTYEVTAQAPGTYTIPSPDSSAKSLVLHVLAGTASANSAPATSGPANTPQVTSNSLSAAASPGDVHLSQNGLAFVHFVIPKHELYVGENVPVEIQIGLRAGTQPSLNGLPALNNDAFTLEKLTDKPEQGQTYIDGQPYIVVTWHSLLAAVRPGNFSLAVETPVSVQVRAPGSRMPGGSMFDDSFFQGMFSTVVQKDITLANDPETIKVVPLPDSGQPRDFTGAVGQFEISSDVSPTTAAVGDPVTLRLKVKGEGSFDRVSSSMLSDVPGWKTYRSSGKFIPADSVGYSGEKDFEQAIIPLSTGAQTPPALTFSFFNPDSHQYETLHTDPPVVAVSPSANPLPSASSAANPPSVASTAPPAPVDGLRPDEAETGAGIATLRPLYFQPAFALAQGILALAFVGAGVWLRRHQQFASDQERIRRSQELKAVAGFLAQMDAAAARRDAPFFFGFARQALQHALAWRWHMTPAAVTAAEIETHLKGGNENILRVFALADEAAYSGIESAALDFNAWQQTVHQIVQETATL